MIRVVFQESPGLYRIHGVYPGDASTLVNEIRVNGTTYYKAEVKQHYALYKAALSGWGAAAPNPNDARPVFDPRQR